GRLLTAVLGVGGGEGTADLAVQCAARPQAAALVKEAGHLRGHPAEAGTGADDDRVVPGEFLDTGDRGRLVELEPGLAGDLLGHELGNAADVDLGAGFAGALGDR